jgi:hypothetical protein
VSPTPLTAILEGKIDYNNPDFVEGKDVLTLEAHEHASDKAPQDRSTCCGTMQLPEYTMGDQEKLQSGAANTQDDIMRTERIELQKAFK